MASESNAASSKSPMVDKVWMRDQG